MRITEDSKQLPVDDSVDLDCAWSVLPLSEDSVAVPSKNCKFLTRAKFVIFHWPRAEVPKVGQLKLVGTRGLGSQDICLHFLTSTKISYPRNYPN
jgi:hypothetical protein